MNHVKIGEKIRITGNSVFHGFRIGEVVEVIKIDSFGHPDECCNSNGKFWSVGEDDYEKLNDKEDAK